MIWPAWVEPAAWTFLVILAAEVVVLFVRAWRGNQQMRSLIRYTMQVRQSVQTLTEAVSKGLESTTHDLLVALNDLPEISKTLHAIDERDERTVAR
jgi:hypothetical protein